MLLQAAPALKKGVDLERTSSQALEVLLLETGKKLED